MDHFKTILVEFLRDLRAQRLRTALTIFGIIWGTVAIIVLLAFGMGFKRQLSINMHGIGESIAIMFPGSTTKPFEGFGIGRPIRLIEEDAWLLAGQVPAIAKISPEYIWYDHPIRVKENIINTSVTGVYPIYADMRNIIPEKGGRFVNDPDIKDRKRVALIGDEVKRLLFGDEEAIGKLVHVGPVPFTVIGVMQKKTQNSSYNRRDRDRVFIPATTFASVFGFEHISNIIFQPRDPTKSEETILQVREVLGRRYKFDPTDKNAIWIWNTAQFDEFMFYFFLAFNIFMGFIGSFTLGVGGIGVANIMYIVVQERTKEIGIRRAVGARRSNILFQFFMESFMIVGVGSSIGFLFAFLITEAMQFIPIREFVGTPEISLEVAAVTMFVLGIVGLAAALFPARRAANLNVVDCLRA
ncbi:MAG: ABC transporter permease [Bacteroidetes bacterium]|nr:ABC transporter permease [Bacteroidota bacterium]